MAGKRGRSSVSDEVRAQRDDEIAQRSGIPRVRCWIDVIIGCNAHFTSYSVDFCFVLFIVLSVSGRRVQIVHLSYDGVSRIKVRHSTRPHWQ